MPKGIGYGKNALKKLAKKATKPIRKVAAAAGRASVPLEKSIRAGVKRDVKSIQAAGSAAGRASVPLERKVRAGAKKIIGASNKFDRKIVSAAKSAVKPKATSHTLGGGTLTSRKQTISLKPDRTISVKKKRAKKKM